MKKRIYNTQEEPDEEVVSSFVVRLGEFKLLMDDIRSSRMKHPEQHYLIQGLRGMGKTMLLKRIKIEVESDAGLNKWLIPVLFNEELYSVSSLSNLWETIAEYLDELNITSEKLLSLFETFEGSKDYSDLCFNALVKYLQKQNKKILLLFDNIGELFFNKLDKKETQRFREILLTCSEIRIVGASAVVLEYTYDYSKPFYDFFHTIHLGGLNQEETMTLLEELQKKIPEKDRINLQEQVPQIETLRILSGGVIRTIVLLDEIILHDKDGTAIEKLEEILDAITPLYKHRMDSLKPQQQKIMDVIAKNWDAISAGELTDKIKENGIKQTSNNISSQLSRLEKNDLIIKKETTTKNNLYQIKERFFNIWYLMRNGSRSDKRKVLWLTRFMEEFYGRDGLNAFVEKHLVRIQSGKYNKYGAYMMAEAISHNKYIDYFQQDKLIKETRNILKESLECELSHSAIEEFDRAQSAYELKDYDKCLEILFSIHPQTDLSYFNIGLIFHLKQDFIKAEYYYLLAVEKEHVGATFNLAKLYRDDLNDLKSAEKYYKIAARKEPAKAMFILGELYRTKFMNITEAEKYYLISVEEGNISAMNNLALIYKTELREFDKAVKYFMMAIEKDSVGSMVNLASLYQFDLKDYENAEKYYVMAEEKGNLEARNNLASLYFRLKKNKKAAFDLVTKLFYLSQDNFHKLNSIRIALWNDKLKEADLWLREIVVKRELLEEFEPNVSSLFQIFLAKKQDYFMLDIFNNNPFNLKDRYKPIYYALMTRLKKDYPNEYLKMGDELKEPVNDILKNIEQLAKDYA